MLSIFVSMIVAVVLSPLPPAAMALVAMAAVVGTGTATLAQGLKAFTDEARSAIKQCLNMFKHLF